MVTVRFFLSSLNKEIKFVYLNLYGKNIYLFIDFILSNSKYIVIPVTISIIIKYMHLVDAFIQSDIQKRNRDEYTVHSQ